MRTIEERQCTLIELDDGRVLGIDNSQIIIYPSLTAFYDMDEGKEICILYP